MLYDGMITGTYTNLEENKSIGMQWRMKDWNDDEYSQVIISLTAEGNNTEVKVFQTHIPEKDRYGKSVHLDNLEGGWTQMIFKRIEQVFGYPINK